MSGSIDPAAQPQLFGHAAAEAAWLGTWRAGRLPHAWMLTGPRGVGKATLAFRLARAYLAGLDAAPRWHDPASPVFRMVAGGSHPDLAVLEPRTGRNGPIERKVEEVRDLLERLRLTSLAGRRVCLIDEADTTLNLHGENTLLKVLEEPPPGLVFLLVAQRPGRLLRTVRSRCTQLRLAPLPDALVAQGLAASGPKSSPEARHALAVAARGSIGRAITLRDTGWLDAFAEVIRVLAAGGGSEAGRLRAMLALTKQAESRGLAGTVDLLASLFNRAAQHAAGRPPPEIVPGEATALSALVQGRPLDRWIGLWEKLASLSERVEALNLDPQPALLHIVHEACSADRDPVASTP